MVLQMVVTFDGYVEMAKAWMKAGEMPTSFIMGNKIHVIRLPDDNEGRDGVVDMVKSLVEKEGVDQYVFMSSAWMVDDKNSKKVLQRKVIECIKANKSNEEMQKIIGKYVGRPSLNPLRKEVLVVSQFTKGEFTKSAFIPIVRKGKKVVRFGKSVANSSSRESYSRFNIWNRYEVNLDVEPKSERRVHNRCEGKECD